jgi:hypothetical protein
LAAAGFTDTVVVVSVSVVGPARMNPPTSPIPCPTAKQSPTDEQAIPDISTAPTGTFSSLHDDPSEVPTAVVVNVALPLPWPMA